MWSLAERTPTLDLNSPYAYLMACLHFHETSIVAEEDGRLIGFVTAYRPPVSPDAVFVWQVVVDADQQGRGIAGRMLDEVLARKACEDVRYLEATVTPSNEGSQRLFRGLAERRGVECHEQPCFAASMFPGEHEDEILLRIGPLAKE